MPPEETSTETTEETSTEPAGTESATDTTGADLAAENARLKAVARKHEDRAKENFAWRKANEDKVRQYDALSEASKTEQERAVEQAKKEAAASARTAADSDALTKFGPRLVGAEFRAQLAGRMDADKVADLVDGLNLGKFLGDDGEVDSDAVKKFVGAIPAATAGASKPGPADLGGGRRTASAVTSGADLYNQRHPQKPTPS